MMDRRDFMRIGGASPLLGLLGGTGLLTGPGAAGAADGDYRALVCVFLSGGNDGHNTLIPTDAGYADYSRARADLAISKDSLVRLNGAGAGHTLGLHPALAPLGNLYNQGRLAWIANAGPLVRPVTVAQVLDKSAAVPSFLLSHSDQTMWQQGWLGDSDGSGWAGRALEGLPTALRNSLNAVTMTTNRTLLLGRRSPVSFLSQGDPRYWGSADLARPDDATTQALNRMAMGQFVNQYQAEYAATLGRSVSDSTLFTQAIQKARAPAANFENNDLANSLKKIASLMPIFKSQGYRRQVFLVQWGNFDTHTGQLGSGPNSQGAQLDIVGKAMSAFDQANLAAGMDLNVTSLMMSDFGRTLQPASGGGTDHAWANHWFVMGGAVAGGQVLGSFPSMVLGGADDWDRAKAGRFVPTIGSDQVGATLMQWLGLPSGELLNTFPNLANFSQKTLGFMRT